MAKAHIAHVTIKDLQEAGIAVTPGAQYIPKAWLPKRPVSLEEVHRRLAKIQTSLSSDIADMREQG